MRKWDKIHTILDGIRAGLTGEPAMDRVFLNRQIQAYQDHPYADEITKGCADLLANTLSTEEWTQWEQAMQADDAQMDASKTQEDQATPGLFGKSLWERHDEWEVTEDTHSDGTKTIAYVNQRTGDVFFQELDSQGHFLSETIEKFTHDKELDNRSDEELFADLMEAKKNCSEAAERESDGPRAVNTQAEEQQSKQDAARDGDGLPSSGLEILLSGMRDYQTNDGDPFVLNRILLGMAETPLFFAVDMEEYEGVGRPDIEYMIEHARRFPLFDTIVALPRDDDVPCEDTPVKVISLRPEEYVPMLAQKDESLLLLDPVDGYPVIIPSEAIRTILLSCVTGTEEENASPHSNVIQNRGPAELLVWQAQDADISEGTKLYVAPGEEAAAVIGGTAEYFFQSGTHELSSKTCPLLFIDHPSGDTGSIVFIRKEKSITLSWKKSAPPWVSAIRYYDVSGTCEIQISNPVAFFDRCIQEQWIPKSTHEMEGFLTLMIDTPLEQALTSAFGKSRKGIRQIREENRDFTRKLHAFLSDALVPLGLKPLTLTVDDLTSSPKEPPYSVVVTRRTRKILEGTEDDPKLEVQTTHYSDGSYSKVIHDHTTDFVEICTVDADGNMMRHSGSFKPM